MFHSSISVSDLTTSHGTVLYCIRLLAYKIDCFNIQKASALPPDKPLPTKVCGTGTSRSCAELSASTTFHCLALFITALPKVLSTIDGRNLMLLSTGHLLSKYLPFPLMVPLHLSPEEKADAFNKVFANQCSTPRVTKIPSLPLPSEQIIFQCIPEESVSLALQKLNVWKATGLPNFKSPSKGMCSTDQ